MHLVPTVDAGDPYSREISFQMLKLAEYRRAWVHRREEMVEFCDDETVRRSVRLDFTLPSDAPQMPGSTKVRLVPFAELKKKRHVHFEIVDDSHRRLPMLTLSESSDYVSEGLIALGQQTLNRDLGQDVESDIRQIAGGTRPQIESALARFHDPSNKPGQVRWTLYNNRTFRALLSRYSYLFLMIVPVKDEPNTRRILEFSYEEQFKREGGLWSLLVGEPAVTLFDAPAASEAESYHFEVIAPDGVKVTEASLTPFNMRGSQASERHSDRSNDCLSRMRLHVRNFPTGARARVRVSLLAERGTWFSAACLSSCFIAAILTIVAYWTRMATVQPPTSQR